MTTLEAGQSTARCGASHVATGDLFGLMATANKLLQIQELMRRIHGDSYAARIAPWQRIIEAKAKHGGTSETAAAVALAKDSPNGPQSLLILAAAVEMKSPNKGAEV